MDKWIKVNAEEVHEIVPVLLDKLLEHNLITDQQVEEIFSAIFDVHKWN